MGDRKLETILKVGTMGLCIGVLLTFGGYLINNFSIEKAKVFQDETGKKYMRLYKEGIDSILVEDPNNSGDYITLKAFLSDKSKNETTRVKNFVYGKK